MGLQYTHGIIEWSKLLGYFLVIFRKLRRHLKSSPLQRIFFRDYVKLVCFFKRLCENSIMIYFTPFQHSTFSLNNCLKKRQLLKIAKSKRKCRTGNSDLIIGGFVCTVYRLHESCVIVNDFILHLKDL